MMEYMTMVIRWANKPQAHINFPKLVTRSYMEEFIHAENEDRYLTVICAQMYTDHLNPYTSQLLTTIKKLWAHPKSPIMTIADFEGLMTLDTPPRFNSYSITHTDVQPAVSFYDHVRTTVAMVKACNWTGRNELPVADDDTMFKLCCKHETHSLVALLPQENNNMIIVQCTEPQTIYDLLLKHGLRCSDVWNSDVGLSARSPCTALVDHKMNIVSVNRIASGSSFTSTSEITTFYHNMKSIKIRARRKALKYKPYRHPMNQVNLSSRDESVSVALYYEHDMTTLSSAIEADGRFVPSYSIEGTHAHYIVEVEPEHSVVLDGPMGAEGDEDNETDIEDEDVDRSMHPLACFVCQDLSDYALSCGHVCCGNCLFRMKRGSHPCGVCRATWKECFRITGNEKLDPQCNACGEMQRWLPDCGHLTCTCYSNRCYVCEKPIKVLRKLFLTEGIL